LDGNKTTAIGQQGDGPVAIFPVPSTPQGARTTFNRAQRVLAERWFRRRMGMSVMQQAALLFWSAPSRIGRRLAAIVAIAAASLPDVGA
jgi:hypothetical protein